MPIHVLPDHVVAQIAAGEVVERPTSVVKELVENAIDASAGSIRIEIEHGGRSRIRVSDDGTGIPADEVEVAFRRHATSKLLDISELAHINTLGFRGEALASIAAVSRIQCVTRHERADNGTILEMEGGRIVQRRAVGAPKGTVVTVERLFFNTPARLKFLRKETTEKRHIVLLVTRYALAYPHVRFVLELDGREVFRSDGRGVLADILATAFGLETAEHMAELNWRESPAEEADSISIKGYVSLPAVSKGDRSQIMLFVNGRWVQDSRLSYAVTQAYHAFLMTGRYPFVVLMINVPSVDVDVNVHPAKSEVRFRDPERVFRAVQRAVRRTLVDIDTIPMLRLRPMSVIDSKQQYDSDPHSIAQSQTSLSLDLQSTGNPTRLSIGPKSDKVNGIHDTPEGVEAPPLRPRSLPIMRVIGQVAATYIVAEGPAGIYLVDQHAAHERILYEEFMDRLQTQEVVAQYALSPEPMTCSPYEAGLLEENLPVLRTIGFDLEVFGPSNFLIRAVPAILASQTPQDVLMEITTDLESGTVPGAKSIEDKIITRICKRAAIKAGQILSYEEMQVIVRQLERCRSPHTCPHGRPTLIHMSSDLIAKEFGRLG